VSGIRDVSSITDNRSAFDEEVVIPRKYKSDKNTTFDQGTTEKANAGEDNKMEAGMSSEISRLK
jgi:hypothetical protein